MNHGNLDVAAQHDLIAATQGMVRTIALRVFHDGSGSVELEDLIAYGQLGLAQAAKKFDPERGIQFSTFAYPRIRGAVLDGVQQLTWWLNRHEYKKRQFQKAAAEILEADEGQVEDNDLLWLKESAEKLATSFCIVHLNELDDAPDGMQQLESNSLNNPVDNLIEQDMRLRISTAIDHLRENEVRFIRAVYFEGCSIKEAGMRIGISKSWASRYHTKLLKKLEQMLAE